jgi:hypothetical protein
VEGHTVLPTRRLAGLTLLLLGTLASCGLTPAGEPAIGGDTCGAAGYRGLVGKNIAAVTLPRAAPIRVLGPDDAATMDHVPERLNIMTNAEGRILRLRCG